MRDKDNKTLVALEKYRGRLVRRIDKEAKKYGFTFEQVAKSYQLSVEEKKQRSEQRLAYYADCIRAWKKLKLKRPVTTSELQEKMTTPRPFFPDPTDYPEYLEYKRVDNLIADFEVEKIERAFL
jgi:hypothetical protein